MELIKFNNSNNIDISELNTLNINLETFETIKNKIIETFNKIGLSTDDKSIYYERHRDGSSILAIKLSKGEDNDMTNYMINGCLVEYYNNEVSCDIGFHADKKVSQRALTVANKNTKDIIHFFKTLEQEMYNEGLSNIELSLQIPLDNYQAKEKSNRGKSKIRSLLKKVITNVSNYAKENNIRKLMTN